MLAIFEDEKEILLLVSKLVAASNWGVQVFK
jgi:hypothetical protein